MSSLPKEDFLAYEMSKWARWNEYANFTTALHTGEEEGREKGKKEVVKNLLVQTDFTMDKIASIVNVTLEFVNKVKNNNLE